PMSATSEPDPYCGRPVGLPVDTTPASLPGPVRLDGRYGRIEKLDAARHGTDLWQAIAGDNTLWPYMGYGPFADEAAFMAWLDARPKLTDPYSYAIIDKDDRAVGIATLMEI